jgi:putative transport protein
VAELGVGGDDDLGPAQESALRGVVARAYQMTRQEAADLDIGSLEDRFSGYVTVQRIVRRGRALEPAKDTRLAIGDRIVLLGRLHELLEAETFIGSETTDTRGLDIIGETRIVLLTNTGFIGETIMAVRCGRRSTPTSAGAFTL